MIRPWEDARPAPMRPSHLAVAALIISVVSTLALAKLGPYVAPGAGAALIGGVAMLFSPLISLSVIVGALTAQWPYQLPKLAGVVGLGATVVWCFARGQPLMVKDRLFVLTVAFFATVLLSIVTANTRAGILRAAGSYASFVALFWMMLIVIQRDATVKLLVSVLLVSNLVNALIGLVQYKFHFIWIVSQVRALQAQGFSVDVIVHQGFRGVFRIDSLTGTPDLLAMNMIAVIPFAGVAALRARTGLRRIAWALMLSVFLIALTLTYSRGSIVGLCAIALVVVGKIGLRRGAPWLLAGGLLLVAAIVISPSLRERVVTTNPFGGGRIDAVTGQTEAAAWRWQSYRYGLYMMRDFALKPAGINQQPGLWERYAPQLVTPGTEWTTPLHNTYMLAVIELGLWGGLLYVAILALTWKTLREARRRLLVIGERDLAALALAAELAIVGVSVANMFYPLIEFRYFWFLVALAAVLLRLARKYESDAATSV